MATRAEQFHADEQRTGKSAERKRAARTKPGVPASKRSRSKVHAAKKAAYALELPANAKRPSRRSSRSSANRSKPDTAYNAAEEIRKGSPESRYRKARARASKARGKVGRD